MRSSTRILRSLRINSLHRPSSSIRSPSIQPYRCPSNPRYPLRPMFSLSQRPLSTSASYKKGLQPDSSDPKPPSIEDPTHLTTAKPAELTQAEYNALADQYIDALVHALEEMAEDPKIGVEVEYSAGVLTLTNPSGTYIINKQPPNKQIWLSSPVSGPKRYDWVITGDGQHQKEGTETHDDGAGGKWVYLRDGSTLSELLRKECDVEVFVGGKERTEGREYEGGMVGVGGSGVSE